MPELSFSNPFICLLLITFICSLLGVFVLWKKLAYFGDALSHSILLGLMFAVIFQANQSWMLILFSVFFGFLVALNIENRYFSKDTIIAIMSYFCVALAMVFNDIWKTNFDFHEYVFGDIKTASDLEIRALALLSFFSVIFVIFNFRKFLLINIDRDLAQIEGIKVDRCNMMFLILLALVIAICVKIVGIFLMTALLILPASIARIFSKSPKQMVFLSIAIGVATCISSFKFASIYDLSSNGLLICALCVIFLISNISLRFFK